MLIALRVIFSHILTGWHGSGWYSMVIKTNEEACAVFKRAAFAK